MQALKTMKGNAIHCSKKLSVGFIKSFQLSTKKVLQNYHKIYKSIRHCLQKLNLQKLLKFFSFSYFVNTFPIMMTNLSAKS